MRIGSHNTENADRIRYVLDPILFSIYTLPLGAIFRKHQLQYHRYVNDAHLYVDLSRALDGEAADAVCRIEKARLCMSDYNILLNENKTEEIIITSPTIRNLGCMVDD